MPDETVHVCRWCGMGSGHTFPILDAAAIAVAGDALHSPESRLPELAGVPDERIKTAARMTVLAYLLTIRGADLEASKIGQVERGDG